MTEPEIFTDGDVASRLLTLVREATSDLVFVSPYVDLWGHMERELETAIKKGVKATVIVRWDKDPGKVGGSKGPATIDRLTAMGATVLTLDDLHAKIYLSDKATLISSMNLTESSTGNSLEVGMSLPNGGSLARDIRIYVGKIRRFAQPLQAKAKEPIRVADAKPVPPFGAPRVSQVGRCIRCGRPIAMNPDRPLCESCYDSWSQWENEDYEEEFCHVCGREAETSYARPLCITCYRRLA